MLRKGTQEKGDEEFSVDHPNAGTLWEAEYMDLELSKYVKLEVKESSA